MKYFFYGFLFVIILAIGSEASAQTSAISIVNQSSYNISSVPYKIQWLPTANGVSANSSRFVTRNVKYAAAGFGTIARQALTGPLGLALTAAFVAAGYLVDGDQVTEDGDTFTQNYRFRGQTGVTPSYAYGYDKVLTGNETCMIYTTSRGDDTSGCGAPTSCFGVATATGSCYYALLRPDNSTYTKQFAVVRQDGSYTFNYPETVLDDTALGNLFDNDPYLQPYLPDVLLDPYTNTPIETTELQDVLRDVEADFNAEYDADPITVPGTDPAIDPAIDTGTEGQTDTLFGCEIFPEVCEFFDWFREGEDFALDDTAPAGTTQTYDADSYADFNGSPISIGGTSSCPAPYNFDVFGSTYGMDYQPFCDLSSMLNPLLLAISTMVGIFYFVRIVSS